jgi:hypothetical protein
LRRITRNKKLIIIMNNPRLHGERVREFLVSIIWKSLYLPLILLIRGMLMDL